MARFTDKLKNRVAIVTGGGSGIGKATSIALAGEGMKVGIFEKRGEKGEAVAQEIQNLGGKVLALTVDISQIDLIKPSVDHIVDHFGRVDILVNNAGLIAFGANPPFWAPVADVPTSNFEEMMKTNYIGTVAMTKAVLPSMIERNDGTIVNIASRYAWPEWTYAENAPYDASKWAVWAFSRCLRQEVHKYNIRVVTVHPGSTATGDNPNYSLVEKGELLAAEDIADMIVYAISVPQRVEIKEVLITHAKE